MSCFLLFVTLKKIFRIAKIERKGGLWARVVDVYTYRSQSFCAPNKSKCGECQHSYLQHNVQPRPHSCNTTLVLKAQCSYCMYYAAPRTPM